MINHNSEIESFLKSMLKIDSARVELYVIKKKEDSINLCRFNLNNDIMDEFILILKEFISKVINNENSFEIREFFDLDYSKGNIRYISTNDVQFFCELLEQIKQFDDIPICEKIKYLTDINFYAFEINHQNFKKIIFFKKKDEVRLIKHAGIMKGTELNRIEEEVLEFDELIDCIYVENLNKIIVFDEEKFEIMFKFRKFYEDFGYRALMDLKDTFIRVDDILLESKFNVPVLKKIVKLKKNGKFLQIKNQEITIDFFRRQSIKLKDKIDDFSIKIEKNKIIISNSKELYNFIDACNDTYVTSIANRNPKVDADIYKAPDKSLIK